MCQKERHADPKLGRDQLRIQCRLPSVATLGRENGDQTYEGAMASESNALPMYQ